MVVDVRLGNGASVPKPTAFAQSARAHANRLGSETSLVSRGRRENRARRRDRYRGEVAKMRAERPGEEWPDPGAPMSHRA